MAQLIRTALIPAALLAVGLALSGCANEPTFGERLIADGERRQRLGREAMAAEADIERGNAMISEARSSRDASEDQLREGRRLVEEGQRTLRRIEDQTR
ncbi:hypothetical protein FP2506_04070 [Fulvimarina pelagi HTCC2506]|uniref:Lipoprotein n=1 Tax=Fulvimarina pelagi HTCC2506 TaxID=314231 RepID=Q0FZA4_9HYPH|nr:hypothetical protein [Fulvimarina pelagi]EAU40374.1 hypothetical protein FP2506_04070 [Fulvimarina pelagi HTCC2506]